MKLIRRINSISNINRYRTLKNNPKSINNDINNKKIIYSSNKVILNFEDELKKLRQNSKIVVTMTTWKERINLCEPALRSILNQTIKPDYIFLTLSSEEFIDKKIPLSLKNLCDSNNIQIVWCDGPNRKTLKKILPILKYLEDDDFIFWTDDDIILPEDILENRLIQFIKYNSAISSDNIGYTHNGWFVDNSKTSIKFIYGAACGIIQSKMLKNWELFCDEKIYNTYEDDHVIPAIMLMNGYTFKVSEKYNVYELIKNYKNDIGYDSGISGLYNSQNTDKIITNRFLELFGKNPNQIYKEYLENNIPILLNDKINNSRMHVIHWLVKNRQNLELNDTEKFHLETLKSYSEFIKNNISNVIVSMAIEDNVNDKLIEFLQNKFKENYNCSNIEFKIIKNNPKIGEFITYRDNVLNHLDEDKNILYTHFKGIYRNENNPNNKVKENYWSTLMYKNCFSYECLLAINNFLMAGSNNTTHKVYNDANELNLCKNNWVDKISQYLQNKNINDLLLLPKVYFSYLGTFYWINCKLIYKYLKLFNINKNDIIEEANNLATKNFGDRFYYIIDGNKVYYTFGNNVSEYFLSTLISEKKAFRVNNPHLNEGDFLKYN